MPTDAYRCLTMPNDAYRCLTVPTHPCSYTLGPHYTYTMAKLCPRYAHAVPTLCPRYAHARYVHAQVRYATSSSGQTHLDGH
jgi:hypothetical protein